MKGHSKDYNKALQIIRDPNFESVDVTRRGYVVKYTDGRQKRVPRKVANEVLKFFK